MEIVNLSTDSTATTECAFSWSFIPFKRLYQPGHEFFEDGDIFCRVLSKHVLLPDEDLDEKCTSSETIVCELAGCHKTFTSVASYEAHYGSFHRNNCLECNRTFPSNFLLDLHILENHDVLFKLSKAKYTRRCLVESCPDKFSSDDERKEHLVSVHKYPANFRFNRPTRKQKKKLAEEGSEDMEITSEKSPDVNVETVPTAAKGGSSIDNMEVTNEDPVEKRRLPKDICFGRGSTAAFQRRGQNRRGKK